jgi:hypothetical protein
VYNHTTIINNYYVDKSRNTIVNEGVPAHALPTRVRQELRKVELADVTPQDSRLPRPERATVTHGKLAVYRPQVPPDLKLASAKPGETPLRPLRTRTETQAPSRAVQIPERAPVLASDRPERAGAAPARTVPASPALERMNRPSRAEVPSRSPAASPPARSGVGTSPGAVTPSRRDTPAATPSGPARRESTAPVRGAPEPTRAPQASPATPQRLTPSEAAPPVRGSAPAARPSASSAPVAPAPARSEVPGSRVSPRSESQAAPVPVPRTEVPARGPVSPAPMRSLPPSPGPGQPAAPRAFPYSPPTRSGGPDLNNGASVRSWANPPARSVTPSSPAAPPRVAPPAFTPPAPQPTSRSASPARYWGGSSRGESAEQAGAGWSSRIQER